MSDPELHRCPAPGCRAQVPFAVFACRSHWRMLPVELRGDLRREWRRGVTEAYLLVHEACTDWLEAHAR